MKILQSRMRSDMLGRLLPLLLLLSSDSLAQDVYDRNAPPTCQWSARFKAFRKYMYQYTAESRNGVVGVANLRNGPKVSCQVEMEVPQACSFIMHTRGCQLTEVSAISPQGEPVYTAASSAESFLTAMERNPLKFTVDHEADVQLYPEEEEPVNIINIKRGIISALLVPLSKEQEEREEQQSSTMTTVHGQCLTDYTVKSRLDFATAVSLSRDLSHCDGFWSREAPSSPLALLQKMHRPLTNLIQSRQDCSYQFDHRGRHITRAMCTEKHLYSLFSHQDNGMSSVITQEVTFQSSRRSSSRSFDVIPGQIKDLYFEDPDQAVVQTEESVLSTLRELVSLGDTQLQRGSSLFHKLMSDLRSLSNATLSRVLPDMLQVAPWLSWQALLQCGSAQCTSAVLRSAVIGGGAGSLEGDALVYGLSLLGKPDSGRVRDLLSLAQHRQSKAVMYALANTVTKFYQGAVTPVVTEVSHFMEMLLDDCSGQDFHVDPEQTIFLVLRVVGVMGKALQAANPRLVSALLRCASRADIPLSNQKAAIQAFRLMDVNEEMRNALVAVYQQAGSPVEKRLAAYMVLMRNPYRGLLADVLATLRDESDEELKSFVWSHLNTIRQSAQPQLEQFRFLIEEALENLLSSSEELPQGRSRTQNMATPFGSLQSRVIFDGTNTLPKEVMLETTLKVLDYNYDIFEVGVEGLGFEPTIDALFGDNGFFPDSMSRVLYWLKDQAGPLREVLQRISPDTQRSNKQVPQDLLDDIKAGVRRLADKMHLSAAPEATAYLRLLGTEIGYMKSSDISKVAETLSMYYRVFFRALPSQVFLELTSKLGNQLFAHYIFMDNVFSLPTASGFPLKFSLAGVVSPGARGGLTFSFTSTDLSFMPSFGLEFITHMGVHVPDFVDAGLEMHTSAYHESSLNAKISMKRNQIRLSIPAPRSNTQLLTFSNKLLSISSSQILIVPPLVEDRTDFSDCQLLFSGLNLCTIVRYSNASSLEEAPYYPLTGETKFAIELQPTGKVSEYTATITDETLREGRRGRSKVESLKLVLKTEGEEEMEATASLKYNRNKHTVVADVVVPDFDIDAGIKLALTDSDGKGKKMRGIVIDVTNRNIPQLTLVGRTRLDRMRDATLQLQMVIPSLGTNASFAATIKRYEDLVMDVETTFNFPKTSCRHRTSLKYDDDKLDMEIKSDLDSDVWNLIPNVEDHHRHLQELLDNVLDQRVAMTDMKYRHIVSKLIVAGKKWLDKLTVQMPYLAQLRRKRGLSDLTLPALPEKLFLQSDSSFRYKFNKDKMVVSLPLPLGGKKSEELNIPTTLSVPQIDLRELGIHIPARKYHLPSFTVPPSLDFTLPLLGLAEAFTRISSNLYSWEASIIGGNNTVDIPNYIGQLKVWGQSPISLLSYKMEGTGMVSGRADDNLKYLLATSFSHSLFDSSISVAETLQVTDHLHARANYRVEASSPLGMQATWYYSAQSTSTLNSDEVSGEGTLDGFLTFGSFHTNTSYTHNYNVRPLDREGRGESTFQLNSPFIQLHNEIQGRYANSELTIVSKTSSLHNIFRHLAELKYKDAQLIFKSNGVTTAAGKSFNNKLEVGVSDHMAIVRMEIQAEDEQNRLYSLLTGSFDSGGVAVNSEGSVTVDRLCHALHKASVTVLRTGLTTSGTNSIQCSPVTVENTFTAAIESRGAALNSMTKVLAEETRAELNIDGKATVTETFFNMALQGHSYGATTRNNMNLHLDRRAMTISGNVMAALQEMASESSHTLTLSLWTLSLHSKTHNTIYENYLFKQDVKVNMKPFVMSLDLENDLKIYDAVLNTKGLLKVEPVKMDWAGSISGAYGDKVNIRNVYELSYENLAGTLKYKTVGTVMNVQLGHGCELQFAGPSCKSRCETQLSSERLRFDSTVHTVALPFSLTVDALVNSEAEIHIGGEHGGQLYCRMLTRAEPLALACSQESRLTTRHLLSNGESFTNTENAFEGLLTLNEQFLKWKVKSQLNNNSAYDQDFVTYNNPEKTGMEFTGLISTDLLSKVSKHKRSPPETQDFSVAASVKYDKASECHIIEMPFIQSFPAAFDLLRNTTVQALESIRNFINSLEINQLISGFHAKLDKLPTQVRDFMLAVDLENKMNQVKAKLDYLIHEFAVTMTDLEDLTKDLLDTLEITVINVTSEFQQLILDTQDYIQAGHLNEKIESIISQAQHKLQAFDENYKVEETIIRILNIIEDIIGQLNLETLTEKYAEWLQDLDSKYLIIDQIKYTLFQMKEAIGNFFNGELFHNMKEYVLSIDFAMYVEQLSHNIAPSDISKVIESMTDVMVNWIDEYEIPNKFNAVYFYFRDLLIKYHFDVGFKDIIDQVVVLVKKFKIEETVQSLTEALKTIQLEFAYDRIMFFLHDIINHLKAIDFRKNIDHLNQHLALLIRNMKEFDYTTFVAETNQKIVTLTSYVNAQIETYELVRKIEAAREFVREIQSTVFAYLEELKNTKIADALKKLKKVIDSTFYNDIKINTIEMLEDMRQRILDMDIRREISVYLQRTSEFYGNVIIYISIQLNAIMEKISQITEDNRVLIQVKQALDQVLGVLQRAELEVPTFTVPLTDLLIPAFTINLYRLSEISIPAQISVPQITILGVYTIPAFTIDFEVLKVKIVSLIDDLKEYEIQTPDPEDIFGDLKVLYFLKLPDVTFPEITLSEIRVPVVNIPTIDLNNVNIGILPVPDIKLPKIPSDICFPVFGKLQGEFRVNVPQYTLVTAGIIENITLTLQHPQFTATLASYAQSSVEPLEYNFEATAKLEAPGMERLHFTEMVKATHSAFSVDHVGSLTLDSHSAEALARTAFKATTQMYTADLDNTMALSLKGGISAKMDTIYSHDSYNPSIESSSQVSVKHNVNATVESVGISVTSQTECEAKWSIQDYFDEGRHTSRTEFDISFNTAKLTFAGETDCRVLKSQQKFTVESVILSHFAVDGICETEFLSLKKSIIVLNGEGHIGDLKVILTATHNAELVDNQVGSVANSLEFIAHPFEIGLSVKNKINTKIFFPLKLTGKVDLQNDYSFIMNSEKQSASWFALARFNQYKYSHSWAAENNELDLFLQLSANGEANLDFLTVPLSIPNITIPYLGITTPRVREFSLWEHAGFKTFLITPQQSFEINLNINYHKNPEAHVLHVPLDRIYNAISYNKDIFQTQFEQFRDSLLETLRHSHNQSKSHYINLESFSQPSRTFRVPGFKLPVLNIEVSGFSAEMPAFSYFVPREVSTPSFKVPALGFPVPAYSLGLPSLEIPAVYVPETWSEMSLPSFTLPAAPNNIHIPSMGNISCDLSFKSNVISLSASAGLYNQSGFVVRLGASSTSVYDLLNGKIDGTSSLTRKMGLKLATSLSLEHNNAVANHECSMSFTSRSIEASVANMAKINFPFLNLELHQEIGANTRAKPNVYFKKAIKYMFYFPLIESISKGSLDINWGLEALSSFVSLEASSRGSYNVTIRDSWAFVSNLDNEANLYLNANNMRATVRTAVASNVDRWEKTERGFNNVLRLDLNKNVALELSLRRLFAIVDLTSNNNFYLTFFRSTGRHILYGELDVVPLKTLMTKFNINAMQPSNLGQAGLMQSIVLSIGSEIQSFAWSGKEQLTLFLHAHDLLLANDESEVRIDLTESVEGPLTFLKEVTLPVYRKTLWDILKFDQVTSTDNSQFLNISFSVAYTKSLDGQAYSVPVELSDSGITFGLPGIGLALPSWIKDIQQSLKTLQFKNPDLPESLTLPVFSLPALNVPFTNLHINSQTIDPQNLHIPRQIDTTAFEFQLPGLPKMSVPSFTLKTEYLQGKMSFVALKLPQYEIKVSSFQLPKSLTFGNYAVNLDEITSQLSNFELPNIVIPEQTIDIPEMSLYVPSSVFVPAFGDLSATLKVSSPIFNISTDATVKKKNSTLETTLSSVSTSTMVFLEYNLISSATLGYEDELISLDGTYKFIHNDVNLNCRHILARHPRAKTQALLTDLRESHHTFTADVTSQTFFDASFRFASHKDSITISMLSPTSGFLGLHLQRRSLSEVSGKLFCHYLSTPDKDTDIFTTTAALQNSKMLVVLTSWNWDVLHDVIEGTKERIPAMSNAVLKFADKYHKDHFGFGLNRGSAMLKTALSNSVEQLYNDASVSLTNLHTSVTDFIDKGQYIYRKNSDHFMSVRVQNIIETLSVQSEKIVNYTQNQLNYFLHVVRYFLRHVKFNVPGREQKLSISQIWQLAHQSVSRALEKVFRSFSNHLAEIFGSIRQVRFSPVGTDVVIDGSDILDKTISLVNVASDQLRLLAHKVLRFLHKMVSDFSRAAVENCQDLLFYLQDENLVLASKLNVIQTDIEKFSQEHHKVVSIILNEYKELSNLKVQQVYEALNMERVNNDTRQVITTFQSHLYRGIYNLMNLVEQTSQITAPYVQVNNNNMDVQVPLPFRWRSFSEWPGQLRF